MLVQAVCLFLAFALCLGQSVEDSISFNAIRPGDPASHSNSLQLECSISSSSSDIAVIDEMYVESDGNVLGEIIGKSTVNKLGDSVLEVSGQLEHEGSSSIELTWVADTDGYDRKYKCVIAGDSIFGVPLSYSKDITVKPADKSNNKEQESNELTGKVDQCLALSETAENNTVLLEDLAVKLKEVYALTKGSNKYEEEFQQLKEQVSDLSNKQDSAQEDAENIEELKVQVSHLNDNLKNQVQDFQDNKQDIELLAKRQDLLFESLGAVLSINRQKYDVSSLYGEHIYIASKKNTNFNLQEMNDLCKASNGYLAEIGDQEELKFVGDFVEAISKDVFAIGGNDVDSEGTFVYYNSKKPVPGDLWRKGEPNNLGNEDCVQITSGGLNDIKCNRQWRYVCEIPLKVFSINRQKYDVSSLFGEHIYIASKDTPNFNLQEMNDLCKASSGYLAEIDDKEELKFVGDFVESISNDVFAIGGNDVESEGHYVYYNSKKPVPGDLWRKGEPNNLGNEDCVQITSDGLNDIRCNRQWRYVCEIPLA